MAFSLYNRVLRSDFLEPNCYTFPSLIKACCGIDFKCIGNSVMIGKVIHCHVVKFLGVECEDDQFVLASLVNLYAKIGDLRACRYIFEMISEPDLVMWNTMISAYGGGGVEGDGEECDVGVCIDALYVFDEMQRYGVKPNEKTLVALISACGRVGALSQGIWAHAYLIRNELEMNVYVCTSLIDMYAKCGYLDVAYQMFLSMVKRDTLCYNAMIGGFALHGCGRMALECFEQMKVEGLFSDDVTILMVLCGCSHAGFVNEAYRIIESMDKVYSIKPKVEHYACLVDLLGRAGRLSEAEHCVRSMPIKPNAAIWRSLLSAATIQGSYKIGEMALENLIQLEPKTSGNYVLLSNIYARISRFDDVKRIRKLMKDNAVEKIPGSSLIEMDGEVHEFLIGDTTHPRSNEIYEKLEEIYHMLQGYRHNTKTKEILFYTE